jgi:Tfp pilus assembly protein PilE
MRIRLYNSIYIKFLSVFLVVFILSMIGALLYATFIQKTNIEESLKDIISKEFLEIENI